MCVLPEEQSAGGSGLQKVAGMILARISLLCCYCHRHPPTVASPEYCWFLLQQLFFTTQREVPHVMLQSGVSLYQDQQYLARFLRTFLSCAAYI